MAATAIGGRARREDAEGVGGAAMREPEAVRTRGVLGEGMLPVLVLRETEDAGLRVPAALLF